MIHFLLNVFTLATPKLWGSCFVYLRDGDIREFSMVKSVTKIDYDTWLRVVTTTSVSMIRSSDVKGYDLID